MQSRPIECRIPTSGVALWLRAAALACAMLCGAIGTAVSAAGTASAPSQATVLNPLSLVKTADLDFGNIITPSTAGTVVLVPTSSPSCSVTGGLVHSGACQPAAFYGYGTDGGMVSINRPNAPITISNGSQTMTIIPVTFDGDPNLTYVSGNPNGNGALRYRINSASGLFSFRIGGTLNVSAGQAPGVYTGTFSVSIHYQ